MTQYNWAAVTGASGGIGRAIVTELVRLGMHVHALALPDADLDSMNGVAGVTVHGVDVRDTAALTQALAELDVDVLVNNAGIIGDLQPAQASNTAVADALIDINLRAAVHATLSVLPGMVSRNLGHVVFTGSIAGHRPTANSAIYSATKAALNAFADGLRLDLHGAAVRVTVLVPGQGGDTPLRRGDGWARCRCQPPVLRCRQRYSPPTSPPWWAWRCRCRRMST